MPSSLSLRTPTTALSRINAGSADEQGFDFGVQPKAKSKPAEETLAEEQFEDEPAKEESADEGIAKEESAKEEPADKEIAKEQPVNEEPAEVDSAEEEPAFRLNPLELEIRSTRAAGRGVFATQDIPARTIVEESPVLVLTKKEWDDGHLNDGVLGGYGFNWTAGGMGVGLGIGEQPVLSSIGYAE